MMYGMTKQNYVITIANSTIDELYSEKGKAQEYADSDDAAERAHCILVCKLIDVIAEFRFGKYTWLERQL